MINGEARDRQPSDGEHDPEADAVLGHLAEHAGVEQ